MRKDYRGERERPTSSWNRAVHGRMRLAGAGIKLAPRIERRVVHTRWTDRTTATRPAIPPGWRPPIQQIANPTQSAGAERIMPKNIVIFSDGTGQAGGINFDEARTNVYKLYRACRLGPDTKIEPSEQVAFYDPGLGSASDGGHFKIGWMRWLYNLASMATGLGIT